MMLLLMAQGRCKEYIKKKNQEHRVTVLENETRIGALANIYRAIHLCSPHKIIVNLDGDDWLAHHEVLAQLDRVYKIAMFGSPMVSSSTTRAMSLASVKKFPEK